MLFFFCLFFLFFSAFFFFFFFFFLLFLLFFSQLRWDGMQKFIIHSRILIGHFDEIVDGNL